MNQPGRAFINFSFSFYLKYLLKYNKNVHTNRYFWINFTNHNFHINISDRFEKYTLVLLDMFSLLMGIL